MQFTLDKDDALTAPGRSKPAGRLVFPEEKHFQPALQAGKPFFMFDNLDLVPIKAWMPAAKAQDIRYFVLPANSGAIGGQTKQLKCPALAVRGSWWPATGEKAPKGL